MTLKDIMIPMEPDDTLVIPHRVMRASAGTGKTYQLVRTYVDLVVNKGVRPTEIIAITFTKKAAAELKTRIRAQLQAHGVSADVMRDLARAPLSNFHGLALQLLRQHGVASGWATPMGVLGEQGEDRRLFLQACEHAWFASPSSLTDALPKTTAHEDVHAAVRTLAPFFSVDRSLPGELWDALSLAREEGLSINADLFFPCDAMALRTRVHNMLLALRERIASIGPSLGGKATLAVDAFLAHPIPDVHGTVFAWADGWSRAGACLNRRTKIRTVVTEDDTTFIKDGPWHVLAEQHGLSLHASMAVLIQAAWEAYEAIKTRRRARDFVDLVTDAVHLLENDSEVYDKVRSQVRAVLVDEAQDTNRLQRHFVRLLVGFASDDSTRPVPQHQKQTTAALCVVGDRKQAIYTFRGADPASFDTFMHDVIARGGSDDVLTISRRSTPPLVHGINHLGYNLFGDAYEPLAPLNAEEMVTHHGASHNASIAHHPAMLWIDVQAEQTGEGEQSAHTLSAAETTLHEARGIAHFIHERMRSTASAGDFAILMAQKTTATLYARALRDVDIPVVLTGGDGFYEQADVIDVLSLLRWITDPSDRLAAAVALRSPLFGLSDSGLLNLLHHGHGDHAHRDGLMALRVGTFIPSEHTAHMVSSFGAQDAAILSQINQHMPSWIAGAQVMSVVDFLEHLEATLHLRAVYLATEDGEQCFANQDRLLSMAESFDGAGRGGVARFAYEMHERMLDGQREAVVPMPSAERHAVSIMTVHQSKGLQFPTVVLAALCQKGRPDRNRVRYDRHEGLLLRPERVADPDHPSVVAPAVAPWRWQESSMRVQEGEDAERRRLLYVAITRAEQHVVFVGRPMHPKKLSTVGFAKFLEPWLPAAVEAGHVQLCTIMPYGASSQASSSCAPTAFGCGDVLSAASTGACPEGVTAQAPAATMLRAAVVASTALHAAPGTRFELPVTHLETYMQCMRRGYWLHVLQQREPQPQWAAASVQDLSSLGATASHALGNHSTVETMMGDTEATPFTPHVDPRSRGRIAHAVLAAMHRLDAHHDDVGAFVDAELSRAGYSPYDPSLASMRSDVMWWLQSEFGQRIRAISARARRHEWPFQLVLPVTPFTAVLHGQMDLLYWDEEGPVVVDFKHAKAASAGITARAYDTQLTAYALAIAHRLRASTSMSTHSSHATSHALATLSPTPWDPQRPIRTALVYLKDRGAPCITTVTPESLDAFQERIITTVRQLATSLWQHPSSFRQNGSGGASPVPQWPGCERTQCLTLGCGFVTRCHSAGGRV